MANDQNETPADRSNMQRMGSMLLGAAKRVLKTAGRRVRERFTELREPSPRRGDDRNAQPPTSTAPTSSPGTSPSTTP